ncbi:hypothetical protein BKA70DRAFT_1430377 [Coprinopsis sp. MPI-PUGE-AT-0042]|nr:hypothetical protein BKA70DRAFT_1430377 [Coprinopsis sp. MPI-PUGE-AT-0042]
MSQTNKRLDLTQSLAPPHQRHTDLRTPLPERMVTAPAEGHYTAGLPGPHTVININPPPPTTNMSPTTPSTRVETWTIGYTLPSNTTLRIGQKVRLWCPYAGAFPRMGTLAAITGYTNAEVYFRVHEDTPEDNDLIIYLAAPIHSTSMAEGEGITHWALSRLPLRKKPLKDQVTRWADERKRMDDIERNIRHLGITTTPATRTDASDPQSQEAPQDQR